MAIHDLGHEAISLTGSQAGIVTDTAHGKAKIVDVRARRIHEALDEDRIVLVAGFQGVSTDHDVTTLGRGGSDTTAVALAAALGAEHCEIYTDVDGVFTADPRLVPDARKLDVVTFEEMLEMASSGASVMATRSVEVARSHDVRLHVRSTFSEDAGTWIREEDDKMLEKALISGVVHQREETVYRVAARRPPGSSRRSPRRASTSTRSSRRARRSSSRRRSRTARDAERALDGLGVTWTARDDLGKVSLVGAGMKSHPGVAAKTFATLEAAGIEAPIVTTSPIKIACSRRERGRRPRRAGAARGVRACLARSASSARPAQSVASRSRCLRERGYDDVRCFASGRSAGTAIDGTRRRGGDARGAAPPATSTSSSSRSAPPRHASSCRTRWPAAPWRRQVVGLPAAGRRPARRARGERRSRAEHDGIVANPNCCTIPLAWR